LRELNQVTGVTSENIVFLKRKFVSSVADSVKAIVEFARSKGLLAPRER
jgi:hypothetical protein